MRKTPKKYEPGENPCGKCQSHSHYACRPRLDGTLCSCQCPRACKTRDVKQSADVERLSRGLLPVTIDELNAMTNRRGPYSV
jgi:hypothetical protein